MKVAKIFIVFTFLLAFAVCVWAQDEKPKIIWKNLQEKYESFYDVKPSIVNEGTSPIYLVEPDYSVTLYHFYEPQNQWYDSRRWICGTGLKLSVKKLKSQKEVLVDFGRNIWDEMTTTDSMMTPQFKSLPNYNGTGKYKLRLYYGLKKSDLSLVEFSPEFEVIEKDFKK